eukprot:TRINITY_DN15426_c0_g1_i1.p1 TRINITY_DN15426_c0_g1~~TRINITY_DN15426_c0_g1_i1.p1  ORF type:complete len:201 (-),score=7.44 TRINITY_DN15426_c0_g1_i1:425-1027(-)
MLVRVGSRSPKYNSQHPLVSLSTRLLLRRKLGEGLVHLKYTGSGHPTHFSSVAQFCDIRLMTLDEVAVGSFHTKVHYLLSLLLDLFCIFTRCSGLRTRAKMLPSSCDDCFVQAHVREYIRRGGPLGIGGRDTRAHVDGHANYVNIIQALMSLQYVKHDEPIDLSSQASTSWAIEGETTRERERERVYVRSHVAGRVQVET